MFVVLCRLRFRIHFIFLSIPHLKLLCSPKFDEFSCFLNVLVEDLFATIQQVFKYYKVLLLLAKVFEMLFVILVGQMSV